MSRCREQSQIDAPVEVVWGLVSDPNRHPQWLPRVVEVQCEGVEQGCTYRQVTKSPIGLEETTFAVDRLDDCHEVMVHCLDTGTFVRFVLTEALGGTFVEMEAGMDPQSVKYRVIDRMTGKRYFRRWIEQALAALREAARGEAARGPVVPAA
jgi:uncharacterized protein YndB with AHSA1/START domain